MPAPPFTPRLDPIRMAMVGGGPGSFIGPVHRMAAELDGRIRLVAGVFSRDAARSREAAAAYGVAPDRVYADVEGMITAEAARLDGVELVAVVTPNHLHFPVSKAALEAGLHVVSDKPAALTLQEALDLKAVADAAAGLYGLTYTYTGYPMVREARQIIADGRLGAIRKVVVEYSQGWLAEAIERSGDKQAGWRADPRQAGVGGCIADIGVHAFNLAEFVSGRRVVRLCADLSRVVAGRVLDDDCNILLRLDNGAPGVLIASQIATGDRNGLRLKVHGERGGLCWSHEDPAVLTVNWIDQPTQVMHAAAGYLSPPARAASRIPTGHPEGFIEAFANLYRDMADAILAGDRTDHTLIPDIDEGVRGMAFVTRAMDANGAGWVDLQGPQA